MTGGVGDVTPVVRDDPHKAEKTSDMLSAYSSIVIPKAAKLESTLSTALRWDGERLECRLIDLAAILGFVA
jgi:hypothetical protein